MISKQDIFDRAVEWQLRHDVVEKDYVLGWVLAAISQHSETSTQWIFKGGTCLKKCYFETYRFSEDLDFTLLPEAVYEVEDLRQILVEVVQVAGELSGIVFPADVVTVRARKDKLGRETYEGKIGYRGPLGIVSAPPIARTSLGSRPRRLGSRPLYVFECANCQKLFRHSKHDSALRSHKTPDGWRCPGRRGHLVRTE